MATPYAPDLEAARLAPAAVCNVVSRVFWLRKKIHEFPPEVQKALKPFTDRVPFEEDLMSGNMERVDLAIKKLGSLQE